MGQSASLYRIDKNDFYKITDNPEDFGLFEIAKEHETFEKTFEGLRFVLSKGLDKKKSELVDQVFYPATFVGEQIDFQNLDLENIPEDFDFDKSPVYYNDPAKVLDIFNLINSITIEDFQNLFDPEELNKEEIYPRDIWNKHTEENYAFNVRDMTLEFKKLKSIFENAVKNSDYLLSFVG